MQWAIDIAIIIVLAILVMQDVKSRSIHWFWLVALLGLFIGQGWYDTNGFGWAGQAGVNLVFVVLQMAGIMVWFSIRERRITTGINTWIGIGDVLFFVVLTTAFSPVNFILFFIGALLLTIIGFLIYQTIAKPTKPLIPLVGTMAATLIVVMMLSHLQFLPGLRNDDYWMNLFFV